MRLSVNESTFPLARGSERCLSICLKRTRTRRPEPRENCPRGIAQERSDVGRERDLRRREREIGANAGPNLNEGQVAKKEAALRNRLARGPQDQERAEPVLREAKESPRSQVLFAPWGRRAEKNSKKGQTNLTKCFI